MNNRAKAAKAAEAAEAKAGKAADKATNTAKRCIAKCDVKVRKIAASTSANSDFDCTDDLAMRNYTNFLVFCASSKCRKQIEEHRRKHEI